MQDRNHPVRRETRAWGLRGARPPERHCGQRRTRAKLAKHHRPARGGREDPTHRLTARERLNQLAFGALIFAIAPGLLGATLVASSVPAATKPLPCPGPAPIIVVAMPLQVPPNPAAPAPMVSA